MNKERRDTLREIAERLENIRDEIDAVLIEEQEYFDNMPEGLQQGEKGERAEEVCGRLQEAYDNADQCIEALAECAE